MSRSMLNWSELLDQYQMKGQDKTRRLKKWSEMGDPKNQEKVSSEMDDPTGRHAPESTEPKVVQPLTGKRRLLEIFYDQVMMDNESIPAMVKEKIETSQNPEREQLLHDLLEINSGHFESN